MSYARITLGLHNLLQSVDGVALAIEYEPRSIQDSPLIYSILEDFAVEDEDSVAMTVYRTMHRLCVLWQDSEQAEATFRALVDAIPLAFRDNRTLYGMCRYAHIVSGDAGWTTIKEIDYRTMDFYSEALDVDTETR